MYFISILYYFYFIFYYIIISHSKTVYLCGDFNIDILNIIIINILKVGAVVKMC